MTGNDVPDLPDLYELYRRLPLWVRFHTWVRWRSSPFEEVAKLVPRGGRILDLGCGYGLMANLLSLRSSRRDVLGVDMSYEKIAAARETVGSRTNIRFEIQDIQNLSAHNQAYTCILIQDVLYLLPFGQWKNVLTWCFHVLEPGGLLLLKEQDTRPRWKYVWNLCQEFLAVRVLHITEGAALTFPGREVIAEGLRTTGFSVEIVPLDKGCCHPHILFLCRKT